MRCRATAAAVAALVAFAACEGGIPSLEEAKQSLAKASEFLENLDAGKIEQLAELVTEIEKDPEKAEKLLKEHGITKEQLEETLEKISHDPQLKQLFDAAKKLADSQQR